MHLAARNVYLHFTPTAHDACGRGRRFSHDFAHAARLALRSVGAEDAFRGISPTARGSLISPWAFRTVKACSRLRDDGSRDVFGREAGLQFTH